MKPKIRKKNREIIVSLLFFLSRKQKLALDHWLRGRKEYKEVMKADYVIVSPPKCGRTWMRMMLSRFFQIRYGLPEGELLGYDNYHKMNSAIPRIRFTHDRYIKDYTGNSDSKCDFYRKMVILLVRDPRDVAVSNYFQWINTVNPYKKNLLNLPERPAEVPIFEYAMMPGFGIPRTVDFLNTWAPELEKTRSHLLVRYEDMRKETSRILDNVLTFLQINASPEELALVVEWTSFENMKKLAEAKDFPFLYLYDETQEVARAYGAVCTPDFFGYNADLELQYRGRLDESGRQPDLGGARRDLFEAMKQVAETGEGPREQVASIGCSIKWRHDGA